MRSEAATSLSSVAIPIETESARPNRVTQWTGRIRRALFDPSVRNGALAVIDQAVVSATNFGTSVVIGRLCAREELGAYYLVLSMFYFVRGIQEQIVSAPYMVYCNRKDGGTLSSYGGSTIAHQAVVAFVTVLCLFGIEGVLSLGYGPQELAGVVWVLLGAFPFMLLRDHIRRLTLARFQVVTTLVVDFVILVLQVGALMALGVTGKLHVESVYLVMGLSCAVATIGWYLADPKQFRFDPKQFLPDWKLNWAFGKWALAGQLVGCSTPFILPWLVSASQGTAETGLLAACSTVVGVANMFLMGMSNFTAPKAIRAYATGGVSQLRTVLWRSLALFGVTLGGFCLLVAITGDWLAVVVYGSKFSGAGPVMELLALGVLANSVSMVVGNGLWAVDRPAANFRADVCALVMVVAASAIFLPLYGAWGAALAMFLGFLGGASVRSWTLVRVIRSISTNPI